MCLRFLVHAGLITFTSFVVFGVIPLLGYVAFAGSDFSETTLFIIACVLTAIMLFTLGALKVCVHSATGARWVVGGA